MDDAFYAGALVLAAVTVPAAVPHEAPAPEPRQEQHAIMLDASLYSSGGLEVLGDAGHAFG